MRAADGWESARFTGIFLASGLYCPQAVCSPAAANAGRWAADVLDRGQVKVRSGMMSNSRKSSNSQFVIVSSDEAKSEPYPYVYVNDDGSVRELHPSERIYLETSFSPFDGARPYTKDSYVMKDGWGSI